MVATPIVGYCCIKLSEALWSDVIGRRGALQIQTRANQKHQSLGIEFVELSKSLHLTASLQFPESISTCIASKTEYKCPSELN